MAGQEQRNFYSKAEQVANSLSALIGIVNNWRARGMPDPTGRVLETVKSGQEALQDLWNDEDFCDNEARPSASGGFFNKAVRQVAGEISDRLTNRWYLDIVFDHDPCSPEGHFVEVESPAGTGVKVGTWIWINRGDGYWALRLTLADFLSPAKSAKQEDARPEEKDIIGPADGYIGDSKTVREKDGVIYIEHEHSDGSSYVIRMDPLVIAHFLGWLEDTELFKSIPRGFSNLIPEEAEK